MSLVFTVSILFLPFGGVFEDVLLGPTELYSDLKDRGSLSSVLDLLQTDDFLL